MNFKNIEGQLERWIEELSQYNIILQHRPGKNHCNADALSRILHTLDLCYEYRPGVDLNQLPCGGVISALELNNNGQLLKMT